MHPALDIRILNELPAENKLLAARTGLWGDLQKLRRLVRSADDKQRIRYVPALHRFLDPSKIPVPQDWERSQSERLPAFVARIVFALRCMLGILSDHSVSADICFACWDHVWPWIHFLYDYHDHLAQIIEFTDQDDPPVIPIYAWFVIFASRCPEKKIAFISNARGFRGVLTRVWRLAPAFKGTHAYEPFLTSLARFLRDLSFSNTEQISELMAGAGGSPHDFAPLVVQYLDHISLQPSTAQVPGYHFARILHFVMLFMTLKASPDKSPYKDVIDVLCAHGFVHAFIGAMHSLLDDSVQGGEQMAHGALLLLQNLFVRSPGYQSLPLAIRTGFLSTLAGMCIKFGSAVDKEIRFFVQMLLPFSMAYYHVVVAFSEVVDELLELVQSPDLQAQPLSQEFTFCITVGARRVRLLDMMEADDFVLRACDNLVCGVILERSRLRRCSKCRSSYYCTRECQITDWKAGSHLKICGSSKMLTLGESPSCNLGFRERQFLRALVQVAYEESMNPICVQQVMRMAEGQQPFVFFDFMCNPPEISADSVEHSILLESLHESGAIPEWDCLVERARASGGRMQLHLIRVVEGEQKRLWVIPMRSSSDYIDKYLRRCVEIVREDPEGGTIGVEEEVERMLANRGDLVEIH
ncbi:hypothetical protein R3P38DRAFT_3117026 [Favolaschia claudopus]|uniref:MYND-type domain-containing protein n=1 Tax=Favolaschia claudopus TaxID=2862362 RepID=A0AAV9ZFA3_9AGAR